MYVEAEARVQQLLVQARPRISRPRSRRGDITSWTYGVVLYMLSLVRREPNQQLYLQAFHQRHIRALSSQVELSFASVLSSFFCLFQHSLNASICSDHSESALLSHSPIHGSFAETQGRSEQRVSHSPRLCKLSSPWYRRSSCSELRSHLFGSSATHSSILQVIRRL